MLNSQDPSTHVNTFQIPHSVASGIWVVSPLQGSSGGALPSPSVKAPCSGTDTGQTPTAPTAAVAAAKAEAEARSRRPPPGEETGSAAAAAAAAAAVAAVQTSPGPSAAASLSLQTQADNSTQHAYGTEHHDTPAASSHGYRSPEACNVDGPEESTQFTQSEAEPSQPAKRSAFDVLLKGQRDSRQRQHIFYLERVEHSEQGDGSWRWHWWEKGSAAAPVGLPTPCWSASTTASTGRQGATTKSVILLQSNAAPAAEPLSWQSTLTHGQHRRPISGVSHSRSPSTTGLCAARRRRPPPAGPPPPPPPPLPSNRAPTEGWWRGSVGVTKSALQKAVRLGRASCAVRLAAWLLKAVLGQHWGAGALRVQPSLVRVGMEGGPERTAPCVLTRACAWRVRAGGAHGGPGLLAVGGVACAPTGVHNEARRCWDRARVAVGGAASPQGLGAHHACLCPGTHHVHLCGHVVCVALACHGALEDPGELLRRLPIVCLEDGWLHPSLPLIVWFMVAQSKGYTLGPLHTSAVLSFVHDLSLGGLRDYLPDAPMGPRVSLPTPLWHFEEADALLLPSGGVEESVLVKALILRAGYGGVAGDVEMLRGYARMWAARFEGRGAQHGPPSGGSLFQSASELLRDSNRQLQRQQVLQARANSCKQAPTTHQHPASPWLSFTRHLYTHPHMSQPLPTCPGVDTVGPLRRGDIPLSSIDFHVSDVLTHLMGLPAVAAAGGRLTENCWGTEADPTACLRSAMWLFRSSINHRKWAHEWMADSSPLHPAASLANASPLPCRGAQHPPTPQAPDAARSPHPAAPHTTHPPTPAASRVARSPAPRCADDAAAVELAALLTDLDRDEAVKQRLQPFWQAACQAADQYSSSYVQRRFHQQQQPAEPWQQLDAFR
ncbi:MAG: hypothetical protein WDW36_005559 [Sanguina aurantia]